MKALLSLLIIAVVISSCSRSSITGSGTTTTETRTLSPFSGVRVEGQGKVHLVQGTQQKVDVSGYQNLLGIYRTYVTNGVLVLKFDNEYHNIHNNNIEVNIVIPDLSYASINGSGDIWMSNFNGNSLEAEINGSGDIYSTGNTYLTTRLQISGSGYIRGREITSNNAEASISGSGKIDVTCTNKLEAKISGSGEINYWGAPQQVSTEINGSGKINKKQ